MHDHRQVQPRRALFSLQTNLERRLVNEHPAASACAVVEGSKVQPDAAAGVGAEIHGCLGPRLAVVAPGFQDVVAAVVVQRQKVLVVGNLRAGIEQIGRFDLILADRSRIAQDRVTPEGQRGRTGIGRDRDALADAGVAIDVGTVAVGAGAHGVGPVVAIVVGVAGRQHRVGHVPGKGHTGVIRLGWVSLDASVSQQFVARAGIAVGDSVAEGQHRGPAAGSRHLPRHGVARKRRLRRPVDAAIEGRVKSGRKLRAEERRIERENLRLPVRRCSQLVVRRGIIAGQARAGDVPRVAVVRGAGNAALRFDARRLDLAVADPEGVIGGEVRRQGNAVVWPWRRHGVPRSAAVGRAVEGAEARRKQCVVGREVRRHRQPQHGLQVNGIRQRLPGHPMVG